MPTPTAAAQEPQPSPREACVVCSEPTGCNDIDCAADAHSHAECRATQARTLRFRILRLWNTILNTLTRDKDEG